VDRVSESDSEGRGFDSPPTHNININYAKPKNYILYNIETIEKGAVQVSTLKIQYYYDASQD
jgi:hypothetical protein